MGFFSSSTEKSAAAQNPVRTDVTSQYGSGAEQDRYGSHFSVPPNTLNKGVDKLKQAAYEHGSGAEQDRQDAHFGVGAKGYDALKAIAHYKGDGAEQDRYYAHFSPAMRDSDASMVKEAVGSIAMNGNKANFFGLGYDGRQRAKLLAGSGTGAEQDRHGSHFSLDQNTVVSLAKKLEAGAKDVLPRK